MFKNLPCLVLANRDMMAIPAYQNNHHLPFRLPNFEVQDWMAYQDKASKYTDKNILPMNPSC